MSPRCDSPQLHPLESGATTRFAGDGKRFTVVTIVSGECWLTQTGDARGDVILRRGESLLFQGRGLIVAQATGGPAVLERTVLETPHGSSGAVGSWLRRFFASPA